MSLHLVYRLLILQFVFGYALFEDKSPGLYEQSFHLNFKAETKLVV